MKEPEWKICLMLHTTLVGYMRCTLHTGEVDKVVKTLKHRAGHGHLKFPGHSNITFKNNNPLTNERHWVLKVWLKMASQRNSLKKTKTLTIWLWCTFHDVSLNVQRLQFLHRNLHSSFSPFIVKWAGLISDKPCIHSTSPYTSDVTHYTHTLIKTRHKTLGVWHTHLLIRSS